MSPELVAFDVYVFGGCNVDILEIVVAISFCISLVSPPTTYVIHTDG